MLEMEDLSISFGGLRAVDGVSFCVGEKVIHGLIGPNGSGKTTILNIVSGFYRPETGAVRFGGEDIAGKSPHAIARRGIIRTFQMALLQEERSLLENVLLGGHCGDRGLVRDLWSDRRGAAQRRQAEAMLAYVGLGDLGHELVKNIPIGLRHMVEIARALAARPKLLLLDEPSTGLNSAEVTALSEIIRRIRDAIGSVLIIEHNMKIIMSICDTITVLDSGRKIAEGPPADVRGNPKVIESYLGRGGAGRA